MFSHKRGQSTLEYAVVTAVIISALLVMGWKWFKGAYEGKMYEASNQISTTQFDPEHSTGYSAQRRISNSRETLSSNQNLVNFDTSTNETINSTDTTNTTALNTR